MSKRTDIAKNMAENEEQVKMGQSTWLSVIYAFERQGYQVVKNSETAEYQGLRNASDN